MVSSPRLRGPPDAADVLIGGFAAVL